MSELFSLEWRVALAGMTIEQAVYPGWDLSKPISFSLYSLTAASSGDDFNAMTYTESTA